MPRLLSCEVPAGDCEEHRDAGDDDGGCLCTCSGSRQTCSASVPYRKGRSSYQPNHVPHFQYMARHVYTYTHIYIYHIPQTYLNMMLVIVSAYLWLAPWLSITCFHPISLVKLRLRSQPGRLGGSRSCIPNLGPGALLEAKTRTDYYQPLGLDKSPNSSDEPSYGGSSGFNGIALLESRFWGSGPRLTACSCGGAGP